jgi:hypothetical protein
MLLTSFSHALPERPDPNAFWIGEYPMTWCCIQRLGIPERRKIRSVSALSSRPLSMPEFVYSTKSRYVRSWTQGTNTGRTLPILPDATRL